jgi:hypothetical protein
MATSLVHALLEATHNFTEDEFHRLPETTKRLLRAELYDALNRDRRIMPLLIKLIKENHKNGGPSEKLFEALAARMRENYDQITKI